VARLETRLRALPELTPYAALPGAGAAGGLGAAFAALGAELAPGAALVLDEVGFDPTGFDLVVTGEGAVDRTTPEGKAPGEVTARCRAAGVRCAVFGGRVVEPLHGAEIYELSGDPARAADDLRVLGEELARRLAA
jgi:glycerate kinase